MVQTLKIRKIAVICMLINICSAFAPAIIWKYIYLTSLALLPTLAIFEGVFNGKLWRFPTETNENIIIKENPKCIMIIIFAYLLIIVKTFCYMFSSNF
jgi:hypothetical protein